jgi:hypothetical protein
MPSVLEPPDRDTIVLLGQAGGEADPTLSLTIAAPTLASIAPDHQFASAICDSSWRGLPRRPALAQTSTWLAAPLTASGPVSRSFDPPTPTPEDVPMSPPIEITGQRFGRLEVIERAENQGGQTRWTCICDCGTETTVNGGDLASGATKSCGCLQREGARERIREQNFTHGHARPGRRHPLYSAWGKMRERCSNPNATDYHHYGGRQPNPIKVCERWDDFALFLADVGDRPAPGYQLDRIDNDRGYEPGNVQFLSPAEHRRKHCEAVAA